MFFKAADKVNLRTRHSSGPGADSSRGDETNDKVIEIQTASEEEEKDVSKERTEGQRGKTQSASRPVECKISKDQKEAERQVESGEAAEQQNNSRCVRSTVKNASKQKEISKAPEKITETLSKRPVSRQEEDIVIKQAKVLLSDVLRRDKTVIDARLQGDIDEGRFFSSALKDMQSTEEEENGGRYCHSMQRRIVRRKLRPRAAKTKAEDKQSPKGSLGKEAPVTVKTEFSEESSQQLSPLRHADPPAACINPLPHKSVISAKATANLRSNANPQAHTQSNIPLKKRTFRSSVEVDSEQRVSSAADQVPQTASELNFPSALRHELSPSSGESSKGRRDGKVRPRRTELQRLGPKRFTKQASASRVLRSRANEAQRRHLWRKVRQCKQERLDEEDDGGGGGGNAQALDSDEHAEGSQLEDTKNLSCQKNDHMDTIDEQTDSEDAKAGPNFKFRLKRRRGRVWEMQNAGLENIALKAEKGEELLACDPFKAIMDSVSILNMEMEAAQAHVQASKKSKSKSHRSKKKSEKFSEKQAINSCPGLKPEKDLENICGPTVRPDDKVETKEKVEREFGSMQHLEKSEDQKSEVSPVAAHETKIEDRFLRNCCLFESGLQQKEDPGSEASAHSLPVIKLRRKTEDIWEVDSKEEQAELKVEPKVEREVKAQILGKQRGCLDFSKPKDECFASQRVSGNAAFLKVEPPPFSLSLSPLSLSSPLNDGKAEAISSAAERAAERPEMNSGGRKQRHKMDRTRKCGPVETPTTCLSHTLQQIDNSLSRLSEGLCSSQTLEKPAACTSASNSVIQPPSQSPPFTTADNMLSAEPSFTNCCDDILDFQCLNFEGYYQPQNILPSSPSDLCSLDPPTDPFSSPLSHSPADTWTTETPYLGPPSPGNNFTSEDLQFFPGLISSKSDAVPLECEAKDASKDRNASNPGFGFSAQGNIDLTVRERSKNPGMRMCKDDLKAQSSSIAGRPRVCGLASTSVLSQNPLALTHPSMSIKPNTSQSKPQSNLKMQGPFHRMTIPGKSQSFPSTQPNTVKAVPQSCLTKSVPPPQTSNKFLSPHLFTARNPNPPDNPFNFLEKPSTVIHRVLKYQGGNQSQNLYSAPCKESMAAGSPIVASRTLGAKTDHSEKTQSTPKFVPAESHHKGSLSGFGKDLGHLCSPSNPSRANQHFSKTNSSVPQSFHKNKMSTDKLESVETNMIYKNFSALPRPFFFPSKMPDGYPSPPDKSLKPDKPTASTSDKHQPCYAQQDTFDFSFASSLSPMSQHSSPQVIHGTPPGTPATKNQSAAAASIPYGYPPYVLNFSGDHSLTLGLRDGADGPGLAPTNYTYHCLMEPSGTQGRLVLEPCGPQLSNPAAAFSLSGFSGLKGPDEHCRKDMQQQCQPGEHQGASHYGPVPPSHSMGANKPKRVRLVVTDGTVDLDLQYSD